MAENLKVTHYRNGEAIPNVNGNTDWKNLINGAYCNYDNDSSNVATYGLLYNLYTVVNSRNIEPVGWHVPSYTEWQTLLDYLGFSTIAGGKMKETRTTHWNSPNTGATNESGFSASVFNAFLGPLMTTKWAFFLSYFFLILKRCLRQNNFSAISLTISLL